MLVRRILLHHHDALIRTRGDPSLPLEVTDLLALHSDCSSTALLPNSCIHKKNRSCCKDVVFTFAPNTGEKMTRVALPRNTTCERWWSWIFVITGGRRVVLLVRCTRTLGNSSGRSGFVVVVVFVVVSSHRVCLCCFAVAPTFFILIPLIPPLSVLLSVVCPFF